MSFSLLQLQSIYHTMLPNLIRHRGPRIINQLNEDQEESDVIVDPPPVNQVIVDDEDQQQQPYQKNQCSIHTLPIHHEIAHSPLSKEAKEQSYRGLVNVAAMLLFVSNLRLIMENLTRYGWLIRSPFIDGMPGPDELVLMGCAVWLGLAIIISFMIERKAVQVVNTTYSSEEQKWRTLAGVNTILLLLIPSSATYFLLDSPMYGTVLLLTTTVLTLKLVSYHLVNVELRYFYAYKYAISTYKVGGMSAQYPNNITFMNLCQFVLFPTLCYQPAYPRTERVRVRKVLRHLTETIVSASLMYIIIFQYIQPIMRNTLKSIQDPETKSIHMTSTTFVFLIERLLKLSSTITPWWLIMFYTLFHAWVNLVAELTRFGDRQFYLAWWNASTIAAYWRLWNQPVHAWLKRHIYVPMVAGKSLPDPKVVPGPQVQPMLVKYSKFHASIAIFFVSAVFHELIVALPVKILRLHAFMAIVIQVPLILFTDALEKWYRKRRPNDITGYNTIGNLLMWVAFCVAGLPMGLLLYYMYVCKFSKSIKSTSIYV